MYGRVRTDSGPENQRQMKILKYIVRAVKYFFYFSILLCVFMYILVLLHVVDGNIETMFKNGYDSLWQIAAMFAVISAIYPQFGFVRKDAYLPGESSEVRPLVVEYMESRNYTLESEDGENMTFRSRSAFNRITRMYEDRITFTRDLGGYLVEGLRKDVIRLIYGLENKYRQKDAE